mgnify:FL=1
MASLEEQLLPRSFDTIFMGAAGTSTGIGIGDAPFWINSQYGSSKEQYNGVASDSSNNVIVSGECESDGAGSSDGLITKYGSDGSLTWTKTLGGSPNDRLEAVDVDSNDNIYVSGYLSYDILTAKFNSSGALQWKATRTSAQQPGSDYDVGWCSRIDANDKIYTGGYARTQQNGADQPYWMRHDSDGSNFLSRSLLGKVNGGGNGGGVWNGIDVDSSGNIFVAGLMTSTTSVGTYTGVIAKYNSSAALQFQKQLSDAAGQVSYYGIRLDSNGNIYAVGWSAADGQGDSDALIVKYNSSGALQWQKVLGSSGEEQFRDVVVSPNGEKIWAVGFTPEGAGNRACLITEWDSSGGLTWQRTFGNTGSYESNAEAVRLDSTGALLVAGFVEDLNDNTAVVIKIPNDGSLTATYGSSPNAYTYASCSLTLATAGSTEAASSHADSSISLSGTNKTGNVADAVLTEITQAVA